MAVCLLLLLFLLLFITPSITSFLFLSSTTTHTPSLFYTFSVVWRLYALAFVNKRTSTGEYPCRIWIPMMRQSVSGPAGGNLRCISMRGVKPWETVVVCRPEVEAEVEAHWQMTQRLDRGGRRLALWGHWAVGIGRLRKNGGRFQFYKLGYFVRPWRVFLGVFHHRNMCSLNSQDVFVLKKTIEGGRCDALML